MAVLDEIADEILKEKKLKKHLKIWLMDLEKS